MIINFLFILIAKYLYFAAGVIAIIWFWKLPRREKRETAIFGIIVLPIVYIVSRIAATFYFDPRSFVTNHFTPLVPHSPDNGFPSDHVLLVSAIASVIFPFDKKTSMMIWFIALLVGISRVYVGIHHSIDIVGSAVISASVSIFFYFVFKSMMHKINSKLS